MSSRNLAAAVFPCDRPCTFAYRNEKFYISDPALGFTREVPMSAFLLSFESAAKALLDCHASRIVPATGGEVIPFRKAG
jgi:hypothetical protein